MPSTCTRRTKLKTICIFIYYIHLIIVIFILVVNLKRRHLNTPLWTSSAYAYTYMCVLWCRHTHKEPVMLMTTTASHHRQFHLVLSDIFSSSSVLNTHTHVQWILKVIPVEVFPNKIYMCGCLVMCWLCTSGCYPKKLLRCMNLDWNSFVA